MTDENYIPTEYEFTLLKAIGDHPGSTAVQLHDHLAGFTTVQCVMRFLHSAEKRGTISRSKIKDKRRQCRGRSLKVSYLTELGIAAIASGKTRLNNSQLGRIKREREFNESSHSALDAFLGMPASRVSG